MYFRRMLEAGTVDITEHIQSERAHSASALPLDCALSRRADARAKGPTSTPTSATTSTMG